jgi:lipoprotein NlpD
MLKGSLRLSPSRRHAPSARAFVLGARPLLWLMCAGLAACASPPPAPIEHRTTPPGGLPRATPSPMQSAPVVTARPSADSAQKPAPAQAPGQPGAQAPAAATVAPARAATEPARPAPSSSPAEASRPAPRPADPAPAPAVQTTPLAPPTVESRPLDGSPPSSAAALPAAPQASASSPASGASAGAAGGEFSWPVPGRVLQSYGETGKGITLAGNLGDPVMAAADGRVIFSGSGPRGYGNLIIVKHPNDLLSVYAHNRKLLVKEGQNVTRGERIAELGDTGGNSPRLHFEIRRQGKPVDPSPYLPRR